MAPAQKAELAALRERLKAGMRPATIARLRKMAQQCALDAEAQEAICFHGSLALLSEHDGDWLGAVKHRKMEIAKIRRLHKLEELNPTDGWALQNYGTVDLEGRRAILAELKRKAVSGIPVQNRKFAFKKSPAPALAGCRRGSGNRSLSRPG